MPDKTTPDNTMPARGRAAASPSAAKIISKEALLPTEAKWTRLMKTTYSDPSGKVRTWESAERQTRPEGCDIDGIGIVATMLQKAGQPGDGAERQGPKLLLLQRQFRAPIGKVCIEVPAGLVDAGETAEECALRELKEETGYVGELAAAAATATTTGKPGTFPIMYNDPGFCNTNLKMIHVTIDLSKSENENPKPHLEDGEFIECFTTPLHTLYSQCRQWEQEGYAIDARVGTLAEGIELARSLHLH